MVAEQLPSWGNTTTVHTKRPCYQTLTFEPRRNHASRGHLMRGHPTLQSKLLLEQLKQS